MSRFIGKKNIYKILIIELHKVKNRLTDGVKKTSFVPDASRWSQSSLWTALTSMPCGHEPVPGH
ncbi:hypothetical protein M3650_23235 [Paenibacillus sp. MER TA 81-3]|uniref:hypothetical protein n=1 Tax=Paenibacillus sp. MER TA 81-3 TaxID=2939573 RepID=UPI00203DA774|nr:hypothetical protein [Paenibacillus sp. MER TA 81-3]MCM3341474.1 hypothetical protein [Paenibacillus sp. MER TA 81-3]